MSEVFVEEFESLTKHLPARDPFKVGVYATQDDLYMAGKLLANQFEGKKQVHASDVIEVAKMVRDARCRVEDQRRAEAAEEAEAERREAAEQGA